MRKLILLILVLALFSTPAFAALTVTNGNPIVVVAGADDDEGTIVSLTKEFEILYLVWTGYDELDDICTLSDGSGTPIYYFPANVVAGQPLVSPMFPENRGKYIGLSIDTNEMDAGTLYIYLRK